MFGLDGDTFEDSTPPFVGKECDMRADQLVLDGEAVENMAEPLTAERCCGTPAIVARADGASPSFTPISADIQHSSRKKGLAEWVWTIMRRNAQEVGRKPAGVGSCVEGGEMQVMLPSARSSDKLSSGEVCLLAESPFRILRAAESGNIEDFMRLFYSDPGRLTVQDGRGRYAAHQAAARNNVNILQFIHNHAGDLNVTDNAKNTPLHLAIEEDALDAIDALMQMRVDTSVFNEKTQAPIHLATELNKVAALEVLSKYKEQIDVDLGGEHGRTALHLAAIHDHEQCARILIIEFGAEPKRPCNNGYYPIHEAAKNASSRTMEEFLKWGESRGCTREAMISLYDNEGNLPLHSAVHGGDIKAVQLCINSGAKISKQQHDMSTPVHLACSQGALDIVKLMFELQPEEKQGCLSLCDVQKMTPLHCAAMFDHADIVNYLVQEGSELNALDKERRSPLLLAASRAGWRTVRVLMQLGANINLTDINSRNVLHLVVMNGGRLEDFAADCKNKDEKSLNQLMNEKDHAGCSPLHYASREGHVRSLENLIKLGACINLKNNNNESPLHFAARYGRYNSVCQLLDSDKGTFIINESSGEGQTPLHIAASEGHIRVVQLLLYRGALLHRDHNGRNPLHLAAMNGFTQTVELLHSVHSHLLDQVDKDGNSALHLATMENRPNSIAQLLSMGCRLLYNKLDMSAIDYAIYYKFPEAALAMVTHEARAAEVMSLRSIRHPCVTLALIAYMPSVFTAVQDKCITKADCKKDSKSFYVKYSFRTLTCPELKDSKDVLDETADVNERRGLLGEKNPKIAMTKWQPLAGLNIKYSFKFYQKSKLEIDAQRLALNDPKFRPPPLCVINAMVTHGRVELLAHPLSQKYLQMKWNSYGKYFHLANLLFYSVFLAFVTLYSYTLMIFRDPLGDEQKKELLATLTVSAVAILTYNSLCVSREIYNMGQRKWHYFLDKINFFSWMLYASSVIMVFPTFIGGLYDIQYSAAAITVFFAWFHLLLLLQRFDKVGIYVVMFLEILQTLVKVLIVFSILIIAFGLAFFILLSNGNHLSFKGIPMSLMRTFTMMLGELDFIGTYVEPYYVSDKSKTLEHPGAVFFILSMFMVLMPILLMNLLIGLAVGDIESVRRNAQLKRLAMQVVLHTELESKLPAFLLAKVDKNELIEYPNEVKCKVNFIDFILRKWFFNPFTEESSLDIPLRTNDENMVTEMAKIKRRVKDMGCTVDSTHNLLRLIVQKMEIKTEADDVDEGVPSEFRTTAPRWAPPRGRHQLRSAPSFNRGHFIY